MANGKPNRTEGYPSLAARRHWRRYAAGIATEVFYVLALTGLGLLFAAAAVVIYR